MSRERDIYTLKLQHLASGKLQLEDSRDFWSWTNIFFITNWTITCEDVMELLGSKTIWRMKVGGSCIHELQHGSSLRPVVSLSVEIKESNPMPFCDSHSHHKLWHTFPAMMDYSFLNSKSKYVLSPLGSYFICFMTDTKKSNENSLIQNTKSKLVTLWITLMELQCCLSSC